MQFHVDQDIAKAETLPSFFYHHQKIFEQQKEKIFYKSWQMIHPDSLPGKEYSASPLWLLRPYIDEPLVLTKNEDGVLKCLSNVCTHRGNLIVTEKSKKRLLSCKYHGRCFDLDGNFKSMPEFEDALDFPRLNDHLKEFKLVKWGPIYFTSLMPTYNIKEVLQKIHQRIGFLNIDEMRFSSQRSKTYTFKANWALYCDNYLEGFHVPFVHEGLNEILDYGEYDTELDEYFNLQVGFAKDDEICFDLPADHPDYGKNIAAYYYWLYPNTMLNFYPWGLSVNIVKPLSVEQTEVQFLSYILDPGKLAEGAGAELDKVEMEDEEIVQNVQQGVKSKFYRTGRFSPSKEKGVHHFHRLLAQDMNS